MKKASILRRGKRACRLGLLSIGLAALAAAQTDTATLRGTVRDTNGKPLPHIVLVVSEMATNMTVRIVETDSRGDYNAPFLKAGTYKLSIMQKGYQTFLQDSIQLDPSQIRYVDPVLPAGEPEDTSATHAPPDLLNKADGVLRGLVDNAERFPTAPEVDRLPSVFPTLITTPNVQGNGTQLNPSIVLGGLSNRNLQSWQSDSVYDDLAPGNYFNPYFYEFVQSTTANAGIDAYRPTSFNLVSKRGSDGFHGSVYARYDNSRADARPFFFPQRDHYSLLDGGGEAMGKILNERLYFYGGWIYMTNPDSQNVYANVPTLQERNRDFSQYLNPSTSPTGQVVVIRDPRNGAPFPNNQIPSNRVSTVANNLLNQGYYPAPNVGGANLFFQNYTFVHPFSNYLYRGNWPIGRLDMRITDDNHLFFRFSESIFSSVTAGTTGELLDTTQETKYHALAVSDNWTLTPHLLNHALIGYNTDNLLRGLSVGKESPLTGDNALNSLGIQGLNINDFTVQGFPSITVNGGLTPLQMPYGGGATNNVAQNDTVLLLQDDLAWSKAGHNIKFGVQGIAVDQLLGMVPLLNYGAFSFSGQFTGLGLSDFLLGIPATSSRILQPKVNDKLHQTIVGLYLGDSFRVNSKLSVDYGVRWDFFGSPRYNDGYMWNWNPSADQVIVQPGTLTAVNQYYPTNIKVIAGNAVPKPNYNNFRPRVSAAYQLTDNLVLRGGYGQYTDGGGWGVNGLINDTNGPYRLVETYNNSLTNGVAAFTWPNAFPSTLSAALIPPVPVNALPVKTVEGVIHQANLTLERVVHDTVVRGSLIGMRGSNINYSVNVNRAVPSTTPITQARMPFPEFSSATQTFTNGTWKYQAVQAAAQRRVGPVILNTSVTWANNVADYLNTYNPYNVLNNWSRDPGDRRLYFVGDVTWALPFGKGQKFLANASSGVNKWVSDWTLQGVVTMATGQYYSPLFTGPDPANSVVGQVTELPNCIGNPNAGARNLNQWFNPKAFAVPSAGQFGNCGVNSLEGYPTHVGHVSLTKRYPLFDWLTVALIIQVSNVTNTPHFSFPQNNISNPGAGVFNTASMIDALYPERSGYRQMDVKLRLTW